MRRLGRALALVAMIVSCAALAAFAVGPHLWPYRALTMLSGSMGHTYPTGSLIFDTRLPASELRVGDVITYHIPVLDHHIETHRIADLRRLRDGTVVIRTKGDANPGPDPWVARIAPGPVWVAHLGIPRLGGYILDLRRLLAVPATRILIAAALLVWLLAGVWRREQAPEPDCADAPGA